MKKVFFGALIGMILAGAAHAAPALVYSTYLGGSASDQAAAVAADALGNVYVAGGTSSGDFPGAGPAAGGDAFVTKLDPAGRLLWTVLLGGSGSDGASGLALDPAGHLVVAGSTRSADFPVRGALQPVHGGGISDAFVARLTPDGAIVWATYLGGSGREDAGGVAVGSGGDVYVGGTTHSADFPLVGPLALPPGAAPPDAFVSKLKADGSALVYSTRLGGESFDSGHALAVDPAGHAYVAGQSSSQDFPLLNDTHTPFFVGEEGFLARLSPSGSALIYSTFLSGSHSDSALAVAADPSGNAYVTGWTASGDFFTLNAVQDDLHAEEEGDTDVFIAKVGSTGDFVYSTYFGGSWSDEGYAIAAGPDGSAWVAGFAWRLDFPQHDPIPGACGPCDGTAQGFLLRLGPAGSPVVFSSLVGGTAEDRLYAIAVNADGGAWAAGSSTSENFPVVNAFQPELRGPSDAVVLKIAQNRPPDCSGASASPSVIWPPNGKMVPVSILGVADPDGDPVTLKVTGIAQDEPGANFSGIGSSVPRVKAERDGKGDGRVYRIVFQASDTAGGACAGEVKVCVPHDRGKDGCVD